ANLLTPKVKDLPSDDASSIKKKLQKSRPLSSEVIPQSIAAKETQAILTFSNPQYQQWCDQNEKDLDRIRLSLTELKTKNIMMGQEIQQQTETIESLITETTQTEQRV